MKKLLLVTLATSLFISCHFCPEPYSTLEPVIVTGQILNLAPGQSFFDIYISHIYNTDSDHLLVPVDSMGKFEARFYTYIPGEIRLIGTNFNFKILTHPGDSIHMSFDASVEGRTEVLKNITFTGDAAKTNQDVAEFQYLSMTDSLYNPKVGANQALREYETEEYLNYLGNLRQRGRELVEQFTAERNPGGEVRTWAKTTIECSYFEQLGIYYPFHKMFKGEPMTGPIPDLFVDAFGEFIPIDLERFIATQSISTGFINRYQMLFNNALIYDPANGIVPDDSGTPADPDQFAEVRVNAYIEKVKDPITRQLLLAHMFFNILEREADAIETYEKYQPVLDKYISLPYIRKPLHDKYLLIKDRLENPEFASSQVFREISESSAGKIMDEIRETHRGKVIYIDFWAPWCSPCLAEMPRARELKKEMEGKEVVFVYICVNAEEDSWKNKLQELGIEGEHYYLNKTQSSEIMSLFEFSGIPHYVMIDRNGNIVPGSNIRPSQAKKQLEKLL